MKKQQKQQEIIDLDSFNDISLYQMIPSGSGMGLSHLKTIVNSCHNGRAKLNSLLIKGSAGLKTHASAFIRAMGFTDYNQIDASLLLSPTGLHPFFCQGSYQAFIISNCEKLVPVVHTPMYHVLTKQQFGLYNYQTQGPDIFPVPGLVILTTKHGSKVAAPIANAVDHIVQLEDYTKEQLELIILQRLKYANISYENGSCQVK